MQLPKRTLMLTWFLAVLLAGIFLVAGFQKIMDPLAFAHALENYRLLPACLIPAIAILLPVWEIAAGLAVLWPAGRRVGAGILLGMSIFFLLAITSAWLRHLDIGCGCFGNSSSKVGWETLGIDLICLLGSAGIIFLNPPTKAFVKMPSQLGP